jgi:hypothetical protein
MQKINKCSCGKEAYIKTHYVTFGQGCFGDTYWVESECGIMGQSFDTFSDTKDKAIDKAITFWNLHNKGIFYDEQ